MKRYATGAAIGAATGPVVHMAGETAAKLISKGPGKWGRLGNAARHAVSRPELARHVAQGVVTGAGVQAIREGAQLHQAKGVVKSYLKGAD